MNRFALLLSCLALNVAGAAAPAADEHPLLDLARELEAVRAQEAARMPLYLGGHGPADVRHAEHALARAQAPADADCASSLGAPVFADLHSEVALAHEAHGDYLRAAEAYRHALACTPRSTRVLHNLAGALFNARDFAAAAGYVERALAIDPRAVNIAALAANIDFISGRWADATSRYRYAASSEVDRTRAAYQQLRYWLAQSRAGIAQPQFVARRHVDTWPRPLMLYLEDQFSEAELANAVRQGDDDYADVGRDERLCEALFYVGEMHLARADAELARAYLAAAVNVKMTRNEEHGLALAEIAKLQAGR